MTKAITRTKQYVGSAQPMTLFLLLLICGNVCFAGQQVSGDRGFRRHHEGHLPAAAAVDGAADPPRPAARTAQDSPRSRR